MAKSVSPAQRNLDEPFFHDRHTQLKITEIAGQQTLVIYAGLGVTIDRTKKNWHGLIEGLLEAPALALSPEQIHGVFAASGGSTIAAASISYELFVDALGATKAQAAVQKRMRELLYPTTLISETGRLVAAIGALMDAWARAGRTVVVVTPNYEDLLLELLRGMTPVPVEVVHITASTKATKADELLAASGMKYVYLHGAVPDNGPFVRPVLHERDYFETETSVRGFLQRLFEQSDTLFVGTSLQDPPLIAALLGAAPGPAPSRRRWALMPLQDAAWSRDRDRKAEEVGYHDLRLRHLGVEGIYPDFFGQIAQFIHEVQECHHQDKPYESPTFGSRYGQRLCRWWDAWEQKHAAPSKQAVAHRALAGFLDDDLRHVLKAHDERLKVELWLRWNPHDRRDLALWASSVGTWRSHDDMRYAPIAADSEVVAVQVFTQGRIVAPRLVDAGRWKAIAGVPLTHKEKNSAQVPIGAAIIASMEGAPPGVLADRAHSALLATALEKLQSAGESIVRTGRLRR